MKTTLFITSLGFASLLAMPASADEASPELAELWKQHCTKCHASDGTGKTKAGRKLRVRDYTAPAVQAEMKDEEMVIAIKEGVQKKGDEVMEGYTEKLSEEEILAFIGYIRAMEAK